MKNTCIVIANAQKAFIYEVTKNTDPFRMPASYLELREKLEHPESRLKEQELVSDKPGHYKSFGQTRGQFIEHTKHHDLEQEKFARQLAESLEKINQKYQQIIICAEPNFQGVLKRQLSSAVKQAIVQYIQKDYVPYCENITGNIKTTDFGEFDELIF